MRKYEYVYRYERKIYGGLIAKKTAFHTFYDAP